MIPLIPFQPPACAVCGNPATCCVADNPAVSVSVGFPATGDMTTLQAPTQPYTNYCREHTPAWWRAASTAQEQIIAQLRSDLAWAQAATQSERDHSHGYREEVAGELARLRSLLRAICDDAEVFGWDNDAIRQARTLLPDLDDDDDDSAESEERAE